MNLEQLQYLVEIAKHRSITNAAEKLFVSPPAISKSISNLEKELGILIFRRSKTGMVPTQQGKTVIKKAYEVIKKLNEFQEEAKSQKKLAKAELKISCTPTLAYPTFYSLLEYQKSFPEVRVEIQEKDASEVVKDVKMEQCDIGFLPSKQTFLDRELDIVYGELGKGSPCICVGRHSHLISHDFVTPEDLINERLIAYNGKIGKYIMNEYFPNNEVILYTNNLDIILKSIIEEVGIAIFFDFAFKKDADLLNGNFFLIPLKTVKLPDSKLWYIHSYMKPFSVHAIRFLDCVKTYWN
ncbi:LysR family transcriptional regulator [Peribacillus frigoritolerans]